MSNGEGIVYVPAMSGYSRIKVGKTMERKKKETRSSTIEEGREMGEAVRLVREKIHKHKQRRL